MGHGELAGGWRSPERVEKQLAPFFDGSGVDGTSDSFAPADLEEKSAPFSLGLIYSNSANPGAERIHIASGLAG